VRYVAAVSVGQEEPQRERDSQQEPHGLTVAPESSERSIELRSEPLLEHRVFVHVVASAEGGQDKIGLQPEPLSLFYPTG